MSARPPASAQRPPAVARRGPAEGAAATPVADAKAPAPARAATSRGPSAAPASSSVPPASSPPSRGATPAPGVSTPPSRAVATAPSRPAGAAPAPSSARLTPRQLIERVGTLLQQDAASRSVMVVVNLNRADRLRALSQDAASRPVMLEVMKRVQSVLRPSDRWAMASHEELWLVLSDLPSAGLAELATRTLQQTLSRAIHFQDPQGRDAVVQMRPMVGAAWMAQTKHADPMVLLAAASQAAQQAVRSEEHVVVRRLESDEAMVDRNELERDLRAALQGNELEVHFQPQVELQSRRCVAVEALIRWTDPKRGVVSPQLIATVCEERGMMPQLTQFVLNTSLRHLAFWRAQSIEVTVGVNISASALADPTFPSAVQQALATWDVPPELLTLELTESSIVENEQVALEFMNQLAGQGCKLAIDDFGTGYSSFAYLRQFPLHELKIDQMFVRNILREQGDQRIVQALVDLAHTFEMRALAEGVESAQAADLLQGFGCDVAQGWHFSKAMPATTFATWFRERAKAG